MFENEYTTYNNEREYPVTPKADPRSINVVERINCCKEDKEKLPKPEDDHITKGIFNLELSNLVDEVRALKNYNLTVKMKDLFSKGGNVVVEDDVELDTAIVVDKDINLSLNGKSISIPEDTVGDGVFHVTNGTLTIDGEGCINGVGKNDYNIAIWADGGKVVINNGTFTNEGATANSDPSHMDLIYTKNGGSVEINGGFFKCATPKWTLNKHDSTDSTIIVKGGTFVNYDPSSSETENPVESFVAEGYKVESEIKDNGDTWYTVVAE